MSVVDDWSLASWQAFSKPLPPGVSAYPELVDRNVVGATNRIERWLISGHLKRTSKSLRTSSPNWPRPAVPDGVESVPSPGSRMRQSLKSERKIVVVAVAGTPHLTSGSTITTRDNVRYSHGSSLAAGLSSSQSSVPATGWILPAGVVPARDSTTLGALSSPATRKITDFALFSTG